MQSTSPTGSIAKGKTNVKQGYADKLDELAKKHKLGFDGTAYVAPDGRKIAVPGTTEREDYERLLKVLRIRGME